MLNDLFTLFFFYIVRLTWGYLTGLYTTRHTGPSHFLPSCLQYIPFTTYVILHTPKQTQIVKPTPHTPVDTQQIITQETPSTPSGKLTTFNVSRTRRNPLRPPIICDLDGRRIDPVELGPTFNLSSMCVIISNAGTLCYSALGTFIDGHKAILRLNAGPPQPWSDVGAGNSARIIDNQLKAVDFEDDILLQWKPGCWSNLAKDTAPAYRWDVAFIPFPHQHNGLHGHTYNNGLQRQFTHIHQLQDFSPSSLFPTSARW
jgi:hypothetical protein